jgi:hypothetical protein
MAAHTSSVMPETAAQLKAFFARHGQHFHQGMSGNMKSWRLVLAITSICGTPRCYIEPMERKAKE